MDLLTIFVFIIIIYLAVATLKFSLWTMLVVLALVALLVWILRAART